MSALADRGRRSTAGKRLTFLTGQAAENDEAFWGHDTWNDDNDESGNESFHSSDEDSEVKRDQFDSDFDESETDNEDEEEAAGAAEERELDELERKNKRKHGNAGYMELSSAGRGLLVKQQPMAKRTKHVKGKRLIGEGLNAGIVLNLPPPGQSLPLVPGIASARQLPAADAVGSSVQSAQFAVIPAPPPPPPLPAHAKQPNARNRSTGPSLAATRKRRHATSVHSPRDRAAKHVTMDQQGDSAKLNSASSVNKQTGKAQSVICKERFSQEDLLLEAVLQTEPENLRWLLGRKRHQAEKDTKEGAAFRESNDRVVEKFVSRRGYLNTISFPDMDHIPKLLQQQSQSSTATAISKNPTVCVITGKTARYRDPKTGHGYHDVAAFRELRRRLEANEFLEPRSNDAEDKKPAALSFPDTSSHTSVSNDKSRNRGVAHKTSKGTETLEMSALSTNQPIQKPATGTSNGRGPLPGLSNGGAAAGASKPPSSKPPYPVPVESSALAGTRYQLTESAPAAAAVPATNPSVLVHPVVVGRESLPAANVGNVVSGDGSRRSPRRRKPPSKILENEPVHLQQQQQQQEPKHSVESCLNETLSCAATDSSAVEEVFYNSKLT